MLPEVLLVAKNGPNAFLQTHTYTLSRSSSESCEVPICLTSLSSVETENNKQSTSSTIGPGKQNLYVKICDNFLIHQFKQMLWVLKRTVSLRRFF